MDEVHASHPSEEPVAANDCEAASDHEEDSRAETRARLDPPFIHSPAPRPATEVQRTKGRPIASGRRARIIWAEEGVREYLEPSASYEKRTDRRPSDMRWRADEKPHVRDSRGIAGHPQTAAPSDLISRAIVR